MDGTEEIYIDLTMTSDQQLAGILLELTDELQARGARAAPDGSHYEWASHCLDEALEAIKQQIREDS